MADALNVANTVRPASAAARISPSLKGFALAATVSATAGTLLFCYRTQLGAARGVVALLHEVTGDVAVVLLVVYLVQHLRRTWCMRRRQPVSWWTGIMAAAGWCVAGVTGVYGQFVELLGAPFVWWLHAIGSAVAVIVVCGHAAYGYRAGPVYRRQA